MGLWTFSNHGAVAAVVSVAVAVSWLQASDKPTTMILDRLRIPKQRLGGRRVENGIIKELIVINFLPDIVINYNCFYNILIMLNL